MNISYSEILKDKKYVMIIVGIIIAVIAIVAIALISKGSGEYKPGDGYVAIITDDEEGKGADEGAVYTYYIYPDKKGTFKYVKTAVIGGPAVEKKVKTGTLKSKEDFSEIKESIKADKWKDATTHLSYVYLENGERLIYPSIEKLAEKVFRAQ